MGKRGSLCSSLPFRAGFCCLFVRLFLVLIGERTMVGEDRHKIAIFSPPVEISVAGFFAALVQHLHWWRNERASSCTSSSKKQKSGGFCYVPLTKWTIEFFPFCNMCRSAFFFLFWFHSSDQIWWPEWRYSFFRDCNLVTQKFFLKPYKIKFSP